MSGHLCGVSVCHKMASRWRRAYRRDGASIYDMAVTLILRSVKHDPCQTNKGCGSSTGVGKAVEYKDTAGYIVSK